MTSTETTAPLIALAGQPNCGKTALFNSLTGSRQKVANYAGVTVERKEGILHTATGKKLRLLDLPGIYSLSPKTLDEEITRDVLLHRIENETPPRLILAVADATNLERSLTLVLELKHLKIPMVLALNMYDLAQARGMDLNLETLEKELGIPVLPTAAPKKQGIPELISHLEERLSKLASPPTEKPDWKASSSEEIRDRFAQVQKILARSTRIPPRPSTWSERIDQFVLHPFWGLLLLAVVLVLMFQAVFTWASVPQDWIESGVSFLGTQLGDWMGAGPLKSLLVDGVLAGVGSVLVFLPQIIILFAFILFLEDFGYMARAAFLMDRLMGGVGLHGRAFIPLLSSFACAIPGIMATRTIDSRRDRLATILIAPLMACSARLPVYSLLIAAFIPNTPVWGPLRLQGIIMFGLFFVGVVSALGVAWILKKTILQGAPSHFLMELPTYKRPSLRNLLLGIWERSKVFLRRAGTVILSLSILLWFLASYPKAPAPTPGEVPQPEITYSYAGKMGKWIEPVLQPIGFDWRISIGLIPGFAAREVMVSAMATVFAIEQGPGEESEEKLLSALGTQLTKSWSLATALSLLVWYIFAPQCLSTLAVTRRETNSWRWPAFMLAYLTFMAYFGAWVVYHWAVAMGWGPA